MDSILAENAPTGIRPSETPRPADLSHRELRLEFCAGDLVVARTGYPTLCEVLAVERNALLRVRGLDWLPGYSVTVAAQEFRPVSKITAD